MHGAVVMTDWYVVPQRATAVRLERATAHSGMAAASAGPLWAWADAAAAPRWHGLRPVGATHAERFALPRPAATQQPSQPAARSSAPVVLRMTPIVLRAMSLAAAVTGRDERDVWTEAAREWLARHLEDDPEPPEPGVSAPAPRPQAQQHARSWSAIDVLLRDLRAPVPGTEDEPAA
jgi:hypothetical protein